MSVSAQARTEAVSRIIQRGLDNLQFHIVSVYSIGPAEARMIALIRLGMRFPDYLTEAGAQELSAAEADVIDWINAQLSAVRSATTDENLQAIP